jgi:hypothetical protein
MPSISMQDTPFAGMSRSFTRRVGPRGSATCPSCGSQLAGRLERRQSRLVGGTRFTVDYYRCGCGRRREVRRPVEGAAAA